MTQRQVDSGEAKQVTPFDNFKSFTRKLLAVKKEEVIEKQSDSKAAKEVEKQGK